MHSNPPLARPLAELARSPGFSGDLHRSDDDHDDLESDEEGEGVGANGMGFDVGMGNEIFNGVVQFDNNQPQGYF